MRKLLLIGGGGHCLAVADSANQMGIWDKIGIIDNKRTEALAGIPVVGKDEDLAMLFEEGWQEAFVSLGSVKFEDVALRRLRFEMTKKIGFSFPVILDPTAVIARGAEIAEGSYVGKCVVVNSMAHIDECAIINTGAIIEHNCQIGSFAHISPGAILCGHVCVGEGTHIGAGSVIRQELTIGRNVLIGMGSVVVKDIPDGTKAFGNPCKEVK